MESKTFDCTVSVPPEHMGATLPSYLLSRVRERWEGTCSHEHGLILRVEGVECVDTSIKGCDGNATVTARARARTLQVRVGDVLEGRVFMSIEEGLILKVRDLVNVFIPAAKMRDYCFDPATRRWRSREREFGVGSDVTFEAAKCRYANRELSVIGTLDSST